MSGGARKRSPESEFWDTLKGKRVVVAYVGGEWETEVGVLVWVDVFTLCLQMETSTPPRRLLVYKHDIRSVSAHPVQG